MIKLVSYFSCRQREARSPHIDQPVVHVRKSEDSGRNDPDQ